jgi:hypothetical protein
VALFTNENSCPPRKGGVGISDGLADRRKLLQQVDAGAGGGEGGGWWQAGWPVWGGRGVGLEVEVSTVP